MGEKEREPGLVALLSQLAPEKKRTIGGHEDLGILAMFFIITRRYSNNKQS